MGNKVSLQFARLAYKYDVHEDVAAELYTFGHYMAWFHESNKRAKVRDLNKRSLALLKESEDLTKFAKNLEENADSYSEEEKYRQVAIMEQKFESLSERVALMSSKQHYEYLNNNILSLSDYDHSK